MDKNISEFYDQKYSQEENVFGHGKPDPIAYTLLANVPRGGSVLEVGAGQGRNALWLAEQSLSVRAIDISAIGTKATDTRAQKLGLENLIAEKGDSREGFREFFDAIISTFVFHHLTHEEALYLLTNMKHHTKLGG